LHGYDYASPGSYSITIVTHRRALLFGEIVHGEMRLNEWGEIARDCWRATPNHFPNILLDEFIIMPNHIHAIIAIIECDNGFVGAQQCFAPTHTPKTNVQPGSIAAIIRSYKSAVTMRFNRRRGTMRWALDVENGLIPAGTRVG